MDTIDCVQVASKFPRPTNDDEVMNGNIASAHLKEMPDYYSRLQVMEAEAGS